MDLEFVRELLLMIEAGRLPSGPAAADQERVVEADRASVQKLIAYLHMLDKNQIIKVDFNPDTGVHNVEGLTEKGRDFLDEIR